MEIAAALEDTGSAVGELRRRASEPVDPGACIVASPGGELALTERVNGEQDEPGVGVAVPLAAEMHVPCVSLTGHVTGDGSAKVGPPDALRARAPVAAAVVGDVALGGCGRADVDSDGPSWLWW